jgi:hypothetical protein
VRFLLENGAAVNATSVDGLTARKLAAARFLRDIISQLSTNPTDAGFGLVDLAALTVPERLMKLHLDKEHEFSMERTTLLQDFVSATRTASYQSALSLSRGKYSI